MKEKNILLEVSRIHEIMGINNKNSLRKLLIESVTRSIDELISLISRGSIKSIDELSAAEKKLVKAFMDVNIDLNRTANNVLEGIFDPAARKFLAKQLSTNLDEVTNLLTKASSKVVMNTATNIPNTVNLSIDGIVARLPDGDGITPGVTLKDTLKGLKEEGPDFISSDAKLLAYQQYFDEVAEEFTTSNPQISKFFGELADDLDLNYQTRFGNQTEKLTEFVDDIKLNGLTDEVTGEVIASSDELAGTADEVVNAADDVVDAADEVADEADELADDADELERLRQENEELQRAEDEWAMAQRMKNKKMKDLEAEFQKDPAFKNLSFWPTFMNSTKKDALDSFRKMLKKYPDETEEQLLKRGEKQLEALQTKITNQKLKKQRLNRATSEEDIALENIKKWRKRMTQGGLLGLTAIALTVGGYLGYKVLTNPGGTIVELVNSQSEKIDEVNAKFTEIRECWSKTSQGFAKLTEEQKTEVLRLGFTCNNFDDMAPDDKQVIDVVFKEAGSEPGVTVNRYEITFNDGSKETLSAGSKTSKSLQSLDSNATTTKIDINHLRTNAANLTQYEAAGYKVLDKGNGLFILNNPSGTPVYELKWNTTTNKYDTTAL